MQQLSARKDSKPKISEYKAMIEELLQQIKKLGSQNQILKKELLQSRANITQTIQKMNIVQQMKDKAQKSKKELQQNLTNDKFYFTLQLTNKNNEISNLRQENQIFKDESLHLSNEKNSLLGQLSSLKKENASLAQTIERLIEEKRVYEYQMAQKDKYHELQVQELRKINMLIKKNFITIEKDYESLLKLNQEEQPPSFAQKYPKKYKQTTAKSTKPKQSLNHHSSFNPQMQEQLWKIKQQVSQQIVRINDNRQQVVKGRVDKTLATIESILSSMSNRVNSSDQQSNQE